MLTGCVSQAHVEEANRLSAITPALQAADFAAQFYGVKPEVVSVLLFEQSSTKVKAQTRSPEGRICHLDMVSVSTDAQAPHGWLMSAIKCDVPNVAGPSTATTIEKVTTTFRTVDVDGRKINLADTSYTENGKQVTCQQYVKETSVAADGTKVSVKIDKTCQTSN